MNQKHQLAASTAAVDRSTLASDRPVQRSEVLTALSTVLIKKVPVLPCHPSSNLRDRVKILTKFNAQSSSSSNVTSSQSELEKYLNEAKEPYIYGEDPSKFNILEFWKVNSGRFPILSRMTRDVLAIPISTVASELAFSTGGRVLDPFRSSLSTRSVQSLICTQDWLRGQLRVPMVSIEEDLADVEKFDKDLDLIGVKSTITEL